MHLMKLLVGFCFIFSSHFAFSQNSDPETYIHQFPNGNQVRVTNTNVHFAISGQSQKLLGYIQGNPTLVTDNTVFLESRPASVDQSIEIISFPKGDAVPAAIYIHDRGFSVVTQSGKLFNEELPGKLKSYARGDTKRQPLVYKMIVGTKEDSGEPYMLLQFVKRHASGSENGPVFLITDGLSRSVIQTHGGADLDEVSGVNGNKLVFKSAEQISQLKAPLEFSDRPLPDRNKISTNSEGERVNIYHIVSQEFEPLHETIQRKNVFVRPIEDYEFLRVAIDRREVGSVTITGEAGGGKSSFVESFVAAVRAGQIPGVPPDTEFWVMDASQILAGTKHVGTIESKIKAIVDYARQSRVILIIDEAHTLRGAGRHSGSDIDVYQLMYRALADGSVRAILNMTDENYTDTMVGDEALARRAPEYKLTSIAKKNVPEALFAWAEKFSYPPLPLEHRNLITSLADELSTRASLVSRAADLLDTVYSTAKVRGVPVEQITTNLIFDVAARKFHVPKEFVIPSLQLAFFNDFKEKFEKEVIGYDEFKVKMYADLEAFIFGLHDRSKPQGRYLFVGGRGLGKTYLPTVYAKLLGVIKGDAKIASRLAEIQGVPTEGVPFEQVNRVMTKKSIANLIDASFRLSGAKATVILADKLMRQGFKYSGAGG